MDKFFISFSRSSNEAETEAIQNHVHLLSTRGTGESISKNSLSRRLLQGGAGPEDRFN